MDNIFDGILFVFNIGWKFLLCDYAYRVFKIFVLEG